MNDFPLTEGSTRCRKRDYSEKSRPTSPPPPGISQVIKWQPIETHPKNKDVSFLVLNPWGDQPERVVHAYYHEKQLYVAFAGMRITNATHWMPMPEGSEL